MVRLHATQTEALWVMMHCCHTESAPFGAVCFPGKALNQRFASAAASGLFLPFQIMWSCTSPCVGVRTHFLRKLTDIPASVSHATIVKTRLSVHVGTGI